MTQASSQRGAAELRAARADQRGLLWSVGLFSVFANLLQLTGSLYMLQVYDRVLGSRSEATLVALSVLVTCMFIALGLLDNARARIMARIGAKMQDRLDRRVFAAAMRTLTQAPNDPTAIAAQRDLEAIQRLWASPVLLAIFDKSSPIHDGAIVIKNNKLLSAGCMLPTSQDLNLDKSFGSRHRAAIGLTEGHDSIVVIVSEEKKL